MMIRVDAEVSDELASAFHLTRHHRAQTTLVGEAHRPGGLQGVLNLLRLARHPGRRGAHDPQRLIGRAHSGGRVRSVSAECASRTTTTGQGECRTELVADRAERGPRKPPGPRKRPRPAGPRRRRPRAGFVDGGAADGGARCRGRRSPRRKPRTVRAERFDDSLLEVLDRWDVADGLGSGSWGALHGQGADHPQPPGLPRVPAQAPSGARHRPLASRRD